VHIFFFHFLADHNQKLFHTIPSQSGYCKQECNHYVTAMGLFTPIPLLLMSYVAIL